LRLAVRNLILALGALAFAGLAIIVIFRDEPTPAKQPIGRTLSAFPIPGSGSASASTQISFRGAGAAEIGTIEVTGSSSGRHVGEFRAHSDGKGASFMPRAPFSAGERVSVRTATDVRGANGGDFTFTVAQTPERKSPRPAEGPEVGNGALQSYDTEPDFQPPAVTVTTAEPGRAPGLVFLAPKAGKGQDGPMIIDDAGETVWVQADAAETWPPTSGCSATRTGRC
jgi:hypothetical protein